MMFKKSIDTGIIFTSNGGDHRLIAGLQDCGGHSDTGGELTWCH
ncbi:unnamed protein product [Staurois parvus]|uniref:Uncharacterized protein n=1 Tax=Staurois parvus TaxID=386267 RepID=A0ABN9F8N5_9NEOB|nr:unnamed protein product [Staurois parvus]